MAQLQLYEKSKDGEYELIENDLLLSTREGIIYQIWSELGQPSWGWKAPYGMTNNILKGKYGTQNDLIITISTKAWKKGVKEIWGWTYVDEKGNAGWIPLLFAYDREFPMGRKKHLEDNEVTDEECYEFMFMLKWRLWVHGSPILFPGCFDWLSKGIKKIPAPKSEVRE